MESTETEVLIFRSKEWGLEFSAPILLRQQLRHDTVRDIKAEVLAVETGQKGSYTFFWRAFCFTKGTYNFFHKNTARQSLL